MIFFKANSLYCKSLLDLNIDWLQNLEYVIRKAEMTITPVCGVIHRKFSGWKRHIFSCFCVNLNPYHIT